jgi:tetratricopeptide (TPR) repeat protein
MIRILVLATFTFIFFGCANMQKQGGVSPTTADRFVLLCHEAEEDGELEVAEKACMQALADARLDHGGTELESHRLYNLGRIERQLRKFPEAENYYKESLKVQESLSTSTPAQIGRRLTALAIVMGQQRKYKNAWPYLSRLLPIATSCSDDDRDVIKRLFTMYADEYAKLKMSSEADLLRTTAAKL